MKKILFKSEEFIIVVDSESKVVYGNVSRNAALEYLVNVTPKLIEGSYAESSFTFKPIFIEADWMHNKALPTAGWYAPYYDEDGDQQQKPVLMNVTLFKERNGLYILPLASTKLVKC